MNIIGIIKNFKSRKKADSKIGHMIVDEVLPIYHDSARTTNKTVFSVVKEEENNIVKTTDLGGMLTSTRNKAYIPGNIVSQNGVPVVVLKRNIKKIKCDLGFTKNGFMRDQLWKISGQGYLGNEKTEYKVLYVTDQFVFFLDISSSSVRLYSFGELSRVLITPINFPVEEIKAFPQRAYKICAEQTKGESEEYIDFGNTENKARENFNRQYPKHLIIKISEADYSAIYRNK